MNNVSYFARQLVAAVAVSGNQYKLFRVPPIVLRNLYLVALEHLAKTGQNPVRFFLHEHTIPYQWDVIPPAISPPRDMTVWINPSSAIIVVTADEIKKGYLSLVWDIGSKRLEEWLQQKDACALCI